MAEPIAPRPIRQDIQAWRAVAVLAVILFHLDLLPGGLGYLGVDVFFVISGYLIGGRLEDAASSGWQGLLVFWRRRITRLWPAASLTMLASWLAARFLLDRYEYHAFLWQLLGGSTLSANMVLWRQIGYFSHDAAIKPLLHMWSLAVEEQFYLFLPFAFLLRRGRLPVILLLTGLSFGIWLYARDHAPSAGFYLLPARAWELGVGVVCALGERRWGGATGSKRWARCWPRPGRTAALAVAGAGTALVLLLASGGLWCNEALAMIVCVGLSAVLLVCPGQARRRYPALLVGVGDRSYALYLVHWPIIALAHNLWLAALPWVWTLALGLATGVAGEILFRLIDRQRRPVDRWRFWFAVHAALALLAAGAIAAAPPQVREGGFRQPNEGLGEACNKAPLFDSERACHTGAHPQVLVWGDSFAMQLVPGLAARIPGGVMQATHVVCGPFADIAPTNAAYPRTWAQACIDWNASVIEALRRDPQIRTVVMAGILSQYVEGGEEGWHLLRRENGRLRQVGRDDARLGADLRRTIGMIRALGKQVLIYRPQPYGDFDIGRCLARRADGLAVMGVAGDCGFASDSALSVSVDRWLGAAARGTGAIMLDPWPVLCPAGRCAAMRDGVPLFADRVHLSRSGSLWLARRLSIPPDMLNENK